MKWTTFAPVLCGVGITIRLSSSRYQHRTWEVANLHLASVPQRIPCDQCIARGVSMPRLSKFEAVGSRSSLRLVIYNRSNCSEAHRLASRRRRLFSITTATSRLAKRESSLFRSRVVRASSVGPAGEHVPPPAEFTSVKRAWRCRFCSSFITK